MILMGVSRPGKGRIGAALAARSGASSAGAGDIHSGENRQFRGTAPACRGLKQSCREALLPNPKLQLACRKNCYELPSAGPRERCRHCAGETLFYSRSARPSGTIAIGVNHSPQEILNDISISTEHAERSP
jgi:hypothetical protein